MLACLAGAPSSAMVKRLKYIGQCLEEISSLAITGTDDTNPAAAYTALGDQITLRPVVSPEAVRAGRRFQQQFLEELPGLMVRPGEALRHHLAWYSPHHDSSSASPSVSPSVSSSMSCNVSSSMSAGVPSSMSWADVFLEDQMYGTALIICRSTSAWPKFLHKQVQLPAGCCVLETGYCSSSLLLYRSTDQLNRSQKSVPSTADCAWLASAVDFTIFCLLSIFVVEWN